jgi:nucleoside 2-deoxyribosyltransferase
MKIYFAGSIRGGRDDKDLYLLLISKLKNYGTVLTEHVGDGSLTDQGEQEKDVAFIYERDMDWIRECDVVVAEVTQPSLGVGYEIGQAESMEKPILCLYRELEGKRVSAMISGNSSLRVEMYENIESVTPILDSFLRN